MNIGNITGIPNDRLAIVEWISNQHLNNQLIIFMLAESRLFFS